MERAQVGRLTAIAGGDLTVLAAFVGYGLLSHAINPIDFPLHAVQTAIPFVLAWAIIAPIGGVYRRRTLESPRRTLVLTALVWTVASLLGGAIRATSLFPGEAPPIFLLANLVFGLAFLLPWRLAVSLWWLRFVSES